MTPAERAANYNKEFAKYPDSQVLLTEIPELISTEMFIGQRQITATWITGNNYKGSGFYGSYPPGYLKRMRALYPDAKKILHLFSGSLNPEDLKKDWPDAEHIRFDKSDEFKPEVVGEAESMSAIFAETCVCQQDGEKFEVELPVFDLILADPPYSEEDALKYGHPLCNKRKVMAECHKLLMPGGTLAWMDQSRPMHGLEWSWYGVISIYRSTNHRIRGVMLFERREVADEPT